MEFKELNTGRHAVKRFNGERLPADVLKKLIDTAHYAPSGVNMQSWYFIIVDSEEKRQEIAAEGRGNNDKQIFGAPGLIVIFSDTEVADRLQAMSDTAELENTVQETWMGRLRGRYIETAKNYTAQYKSDYLALNTGLVAMNLMYAIYDAGYAGNFLLGFKKTPKINEILGVDLRYRPELLVVLGESENQGEQHYRLPLEKIMDVR